MKLSLQILTILLLIGNGLAAWILHNKPQDFIQKFQLTSHSLFWFKWLPLLNIIGLIGIIWFKKWGIFLVIVSSILVILCDIIFKINYHLPIAIISFALLGFLIYKNYHLFN